MSIETAIKRLCGFDLVVVLGGNIRLVNGKYVSTPYKEGTEKSFGGCGRVLTAAMFYHWGIAPRFIVSTGKTHPNPDAPTEAAVMKNEMIGCGVPADCITEEGKSLNTLENAIEVAKLLRSGDFHWCKRIGLITSSWHLRRSLAFFDAQGLVAEGRHITPISSDKFVGQIMPELRPIIRELYHTPSMVARLKREKQGVIDFYAGRYKAEQPY
jgi:uncharacterized SAM-binding protein YcdF (DUF218 family)